MSDFSFLINMIILESHSDTGWITAVIQGRWVQAKVYNEPSTYGIYNGRVSKLAIGLRETRDPTRDFFQQMCFNYDRGLDFNHAPEDLVESIVRELEELPLLDL